MNDGQIRLSQNWGFLVALLPGGAKLRVDTPQAQFDIALSTLDWLGLADEAHGFLGRSVFRRYATTRALAFGNIYSDSVGGLSADGVSVLCTDDLKQCVRKATDEQRLFKVGQKLLPEASAGDLAFLRELVAESMPVSGSGSTGEEAAASLAERDIRLNEASIFEIRDDVDDIQWLFGGQYLSIPANSRIDVDLEVELIGESGLVELQHALKAPGTNFFLNRVPDMRPGDRLHYRYSYSTAEPLVDLGTYLVVMRRAGSGMSLKVLRARLQIQPESGTPDPPLVIHQSELERAPRPSDPRDAARLQ
jgi:hypothetical protein